METLHLISFSPGLHRSLMEDWSRQPHVLRWIPPRITEGFIAVESSAVRRLIVQEGRPVGFIQWHRVTREELDAAGLEGVREGGMDFDLLIGDPEALGFGIGPAAIRQAMAEILESETPPYFSLCTSAANERALRAYRKCGFAQHTCFDEGDGLQLFMMHPIATPGGVPS